MKTEKETKTFFCHSISDCKGPLSIFIHFFVNEEKIVYLNFKEVVTKQRQAIKKEQFLCYHVVVII
jgi:hypothetical protein